MARDYLSEVGLPPLALDTRKREDEESFSPVSEFTKGVGAGVDQVQALGGGLLALAGDATGLDSVRDYGYDIYNEQMRQAGENAAKVGSYTDITDLGSAVEYASHGLGTLLPTFAVTLGAGSLGGFAAKRVLEKGLKSYVEKSVAAKVAAGVPEAQALSEVSQFVTNVGMASGAFAASTGMEAGSIMGDIKQKTGEDASGTALAFGAIAGALDAYPAFRVLRKFGLADDAVEKVAKSITPEILKQAAAEGLTESAQTIIERAAVQTIDENQETFSPEGWQEIIDSGILGAIGGGAIGGFGVRVPKTPEQKSGDQEEQTARDQAAADGGDALDQVLAASQAKANASWSNRVQEDELSSRMETLLSLMNHYGATMDIGSPEIANPENPAPGTVDATQGWQTLAGRRGFASGAQKQDALAQLAQGEYDTGAPVTLDGEDASARAQALARPTEKPDLAKIDQQPYVQTFRQLREQRAKAAQEEEERAKQVRYRALQEENDKRARAGQPPLEDPDAPRKSQIDQLRAQITNIDNQIQTAPYQPEMREAIPGLLKERTLAMRDLATLERDYQVAKTGVDLSEGDRTYGPFPESRIPPAPHELEDLTSPEAPAETPKTPEPTQQEFTAKGFRATEKTARMQEIAKAKREAKAKLTAPETRDEGPLFKDQSQLEISFEDARRRAATHPESEAQPTEAQIQAGNYRKGHVAINGFDVTLENPRGSTRTGTDRNGKAWSRELTHDYGYIKRTDGADGEQVDVFVGPKLDSQKVYVADQYVDGEFDEHKVLMGFESRKAAEEGYRSNYHKDWNGLGALTEMSVDEFKQWVRDPAKTKEPVSETLQPRGEQQPVSRGTPGKSKALAEIARNDPDIEAYTDESDDGNAHVIYFKNKADAAGAKTLFANSVKEARERLSGFTRDNEVARRQAELKEPYEKAYEAVYGKKPQNQNESGLDGVDLTKVEMTRRVKVAETGEEYDVTETADTALRRLDKRIESVQRVLECLGS